VNEIVAGVLFPSGHSWGMDGAGSGSRGRRVRCIG
jgi:hypothetical protein